MTALVLASASRSRAAMLQDAGVNVDCHPADLDEDAVKAWMLADRADGGQIAEALASAKAMHVSHAQPDKLVLGADQVLLIGDELLSKPADRAEARDHLTRLRGRTHVLVSAACLVRGGQTLGEVQARARLTMRDFSDQFLDRYLDDIDDAVLQSVGCYHLEGLGAQLFDSVDGDYFTVLGLPLLPVLAVLRDLGALDH